jgi:hypothetical protein
MTADWTVVPIWPIRFLFDKEAHPPPGRDLLVRKGAQRDSWMVWDRKIGGLAKVARGPAVGLS